MSNWWRALFGNHAEDEDRFQKTLESVDRQIAKLEEVKGEITKAEKTMDAKAASMRVVKSSGISGNMKAVVDDAKPA